MAALERSRLDLGTSPVWELPEILQAQGVRVTEEALPEGVSGAFLYGKDLGPLIIVNENEHRVRRLFSYAHEYAHALLDRARNVLVEHPDCRFVVPEQVLDELTEPRQRVHVDTAIEGGGLELVVSSDLAEIARAVELRRHMDRGEAIVFAVAAHRGWLIATDEGRRTWRMIVEQLGAARQLTTPAILLPLGGVTKQNVGVPTRPTRLRPARPR